MSYRRAAKRKRKTRIEVSIEPELKEWLMAYAEQINVPASALMTLALKIYRRALKEG